MKQGFRWRESDAWGICDCDTRLDDIAMKGPESSWFGMVGVATAELIESTFASKKVSKIEQILAFT
jgi:hypothetical protein